MSDLYSPEAVQEILHLAISHQQDKEELTKQQLAEIAAELGIDAMELQAAEQQWRKLKLVDQKKQEFDRYRQTKLQRKTIRYIVINGCIISLNFLTAGTISWALYILLPWSAALILSVWKTWQTQGEEYQRAFKKWERKTVIQQSLDSFWDKMQRVFS